MNGQKITGLTQVKEKQLKTQKRLLMQLKT